MTVRTRTFIACLLAALVPLALLALGARREVGTRLTAGFESRVASSTRMLHQDLATHAASLDARLDAVDGALRSDPRMRAALVQAGASSAAIDLAPAIMTTAGLDYLLILDSAGTVLSAGHFRSDYGRQAPDVARLPGLQTPALASARRPQGEFLALVRGRRFSLAGMRFTIAAGMAVDSAFVTRLAGGADASLSLSLDYPGGTLHSHSPAEASAAGRGLAEQIELPFIDDVRPQDADAVASRAVVLTLSHSLAPLHDVQRALDRWFLAAAAAAAVLALVIARIVAAHVSRPLEELARRTTRVRLDRVDVGFATRRSDEIGTLSRMLDTMIQRLRDAATQLRDAERRATVGDMARQVNHDIRNGLLPIRNVVHHLAEVSAESPADLNTVFDERRTTLTGGIAYLESLATSYARLAPPLDDQVCDVNEIVRTVARDAVTTDTVRFVFDPAQQPLRVAGDAVAIRRIVENLVVNAVESMAGRTGCVTLATHSTGHDRPQAVIMVTDDGAGIESADIDRIFTDFYTTKERGTGLGLSIVRRLVADMGGRITVDSRPGEGTTFRVELPELQ